MHPLPYSEKEVQSIDSHLNPERVPKYRNWDKMSELERQTVKNRLFVENHEIQRKYSFLADSILQSLEERNIEVNRFKFFLANYNTTLAAKLENANTLADVLLLVRTNYWYYSSWFNIQLFKDIVERFGGNDDQRKMEAYEENDLLQRSIYEIPSNSFSSCDGVGNVIRLGLHLPDNDIPTGQYVAVIRHNLAHLLGIEEGILQFIGYDTGSTILIFGIPESLLHKAVVQTIIKKYFILNTIKNIYNFCGDIPQLL